MNGEKQKGREKKFKLRQMQAKMAHNLMAEKQRETQQSRGMASLMPLRMSVAVRGNKENVMENGTKNIIYYDSGLQPTKQATMNIIIFK